MIPLKMNPEVLQLFLLAYLILGEQVDRCDREKSLEEEETKVKNYMFYHF